MDILLLAGLWLPGSIWDDVVDELARRGHRAVAVELPGADDGSPDATLADQLAATIAVVDRSRQPMVVGHSAACTLAWMAADRRPFAVDPVVLVGGFPAADGETYADLFPASDGVVPFPGWEPFEGPDAADLGEVERERVAALAVPVPEGVAKSVVELRDDRRFDIPVVVVCPEFTADQARAWVAGGDVPELSNAKHLSFVDIDSGHWPMVTKPAELAAILDTAATEVLDEEERYERERQAEHERHERERAAEHRRHEQERMEARERHDRERDEDRRT